jgi:hypothetical protein
VRRHALDLGDDAGAELIVEARVSIDRCVDQASPGDTWHERIAASPDDQG